MLNIVPVIYSWLSQDAKHPGEAEDAVTEAHLFDRLCDTLGKNGIYGHIGFVPDKKRRYFAVDAKDAQTARETLHEYVRQGVYGITGTARPSPFTASEIIEESQVSTFF